jgi:hypothetical protein
VPKRTCDNCAGNDRARGKNDREQNVPEAPSMTRKINNLEEMLVESGNHAPFRSTKSYAIVK